jgi:dTDP-4-amino-4,6-dideoxygalactose transaminase
MQRVAGMILFNDLKRETEPFREEILRAVSRVLDSGWFILGKEVESFESNFAGYIGSRYCVGVASGTEAIALALMAYGIGKGDEVITSNLTAYPTITGIMQSGAKPVVADIESSTGLIDPFGIETKITPLTKAVVPVHLYGQSCDLDVIAEIAERHGLIMIEDCAQAAGATYKGRKVGTIGHCGAFSFYPTKNLGATGDGGAIVTSSELIYRKLLSLRNYGQTERYYHDEYGLNSRLDEIQAAILNVKLQYLDHWNMVRRQIASVYRQQLHTVECLEEKKYGEPVFHLFVVKTSYRNELMKVLREHGIQTLIHYPVPVNRQKSFPGQKDEILGNSYNFANSILSLPLYPGLSLQSVETVIKKINEFQY